MSLFFFSDHTQKSANEQKLQSSILVKNCIVSVNFATFYWSYVILVPGRRQIKPVSHAEIIAESEGYPRYVNPEGPPLPALFQ